MLPIWNLICKYKHVFSFRKYTFQYHDPLNLADQHFLPKSQHFLAKTVTLFKPIAWEFSSVSSFCKVKSYYYSTYKYYRPCSRNLASVLLQIDYKLQTWNWRHNLQRWCHRQFFWRYHVFLVKLSYWSKCHYWFWSYDDFCL